MTLIKDICTKDVQYVDPYTPIDEVSKLMKKHNCGSVLVRESDKIVGIITERDITLRCAAEAKDPSTMTDE